MEISKIIVINYNSEENIERYKICINNEQLEEFSKIVQNPSDGFMVDYLSETAIQALSTSNKYYIIEEDKNNYYQLKILSKIMSGLTSIQDLKSINDIFDSNGNLSCNLIAYISENENGERNLFLYKLAKTNLIKDKGFLKFTKKAGSSEANDVKIEQINNGFNLPTNKCIASLKIEKYGGKKTKYTAKIYNAYEFDNSLNTTETQHTYVKRTLNKFVRPDKPIKLTKDNISVSFKKNKAKTLSSIEQAIFDNVYLTKTFANFHDNKNRIIKKISKKNLEDVLNYLNKYVKQNKNIGFTKKNIPKLIYNKKNITGLKVTKDSVPIFAALLDNKVIERLLDGKVEIPYYN